MKRVGSSHILPFNEVFRPDIKRRKDTGVVAGSLAYAEEVIHPVLNDRVTVRHKMSSNVLSVVVTYT